ncbi:hypothetical protein [Solibacillus sp. FSL H8-0538]|uniref:hypothetical protein n=1 Tax=Solibacillus sp. FSL H8-0538 TaxID=2921400 RepID=UPI0030F68C69
MTHNQQNISSRNAYARFMLGSMMTAYGTIQLMRNPKSKRGQMLVLYGSMKAAEGATRYCPRKAMGSAMSSSNLLQKVMNGNASLVSLAGAGVAMKSGNQSGQSASSSSTNQTGGTIFQMVENILQIVNGGNASQSTSDTQNMSDGGVGQNAAGNNIAQTIEKVAQQMSGGNAAQTIGNIAQTVVPQVGKIMNDVASMTGSQNATGTNNGGKQSSASSGASNENSTTNVNANANNAKNGNSSGGKKASSNSGGTKTTSASKNSGNKQDSSTNGDNSLNAGATKTPLDGTPNNAHLSNIAASVLNASSTNNNASPPNILQ